MSMIFCRGCGKEIHETAVTCPLCGAPQASAPTDPGKKNSKARKPMWAKVLIVIFALLIFAIGKSSYQGYKREHPGANATTAQYDEFAELAAAVPAQLSPTGELATMFNLASENTDLQRENKLKEIKKKIVEWTLPVYEVEQAGSGYAVQTEADATVGAIVYITARNEQDKALIEGLKTGSSISFKGVINGVSMRYLEIKPAILFQPGSAKPVAIEVPQTASTPQTQLSMPDEASSGHNIIIPKAVYPSNIMDEGDIVKRSPVQLVGHIEFVFEKTDGRYDFVSGKEQYLIRYMTVPGNNNDDNFAQEQLDKFAKSKAKVTIKGILITRKYGSPVFDDGTSVTISQ